MHPVIISAILFIPSCFRKKRKNYFFKPTTGFSKNDGNSYLQSTTTSYPGNIDPISDSVNRFADNNSNGYQLSATIAYTEPIGKKGQLQLNYSPSYSKNRANTGVYEFDNVLINILNLIPVCQINLIIQSPHKMQEQLTGLATGITCLQLAHLTSIHY